MSRAATATKRQTIARAAHAVDVSRLGVQVATITGAEWRAFASMTLRRRVWWLLTGRGPHLTAARGIYAEMAPRPVESVAPPPPGPHPRAGRDPVEVQS